MNIPQSAISHGGHSYAFDATGTLNQVNPQPYPYDAGYIERTYGSIPPESLAKTAFLRLGLMIGAVGSARLRVLDYGHGGGAFLRACATMPGLEAHGFEINGLPVPPGTHACPDPMAGRWDVVTFYDTLEHIPSLSFLGLLDTRFLVVSVPDCHAQSKGFDWFWGWKHRKPDEHIHHWNAPALYHTLKRHGYTGIFTGNPEDATRKNVPGEPNILTIIARKTH